MPEFPSILAKQLRSLHYRFGSAIRRQIFRLCYPEITWRRSVIIEANVDIRVMDGGKFIVGDNAVICRNSTIIVQHGSLQIGANSHVGQGCVIVCRDQILIGDDALIAEHVTIQDQYHATSNPGLAHWKQGFVATPIRIGRNVWLGGKVTVTRGVSIGSDSVLGANSVVTNDIPDGTIAVGVPARRIRDVSRTNI